MIHFVSPTPIPEFLYYAPPAGIARLAELIAVANQFDRKDREIHQVENLLRLYAEYTSVEVVEDGLDQTSWGISFIVDNPISTALQEAKALGVDLPIFLQPDRLEVQVPWTQIKAITLAPTAG